MTPFPSRAKEGCRNLSIDRDVSFGDHPAVMNVVARTCLLALVVCVRAQSSPVRVHEIPAPTEVASLTTEQLIDRLQDETAGASDHRSTISVVAFWPVDTAANLQWNMPHDPRSPVLTELVRRGVDAVPALLEHLDDGRPTKLVRLHQPGMSSDGGTYYSNLYDSRAAGTTYARPVNSEVDFRSTRQLAPGDSYKVRIGDLCFVALGQIVDRRLALFGDVFQRGVLYIRSMSLNSPLESPELAAAARQDWAKLTRAEHEQSLAADAHDEWRFYGAVQRLLYYYPETGIRVVHELLQRDLNSKGYTSQVSLVHALDPFDWAGLRGDLTGLLNRADRTRDNGEAIYLILALEDRLDPAMAATTRSRVKVSFRPTR